MDRVPFLDLQGLHAEIRDQMDARWAELVDSGGFIEGPHLGAFESRWADECGAAEAIGVPSASAALELILLGLGIGAGDEVIVPANVSVAVVDAISRAGSTPVFADVDPATLLVTGAGIRAVIGPRTAAVVASHQFGHPFDVADVAAACDEAGIALVEEAAHAPAAAWRGRRVGSFGVAASFDLGPAGNFAGVGDGGAVVTSDPDLAERVRQLIAVDAAERSTALSRPGRLDPLHAAMLDLLLDQLDRWNAARRCVFEWYDALLPPEVELLRPLGDSTAVHHLLVVRVSARNRLQRALTGARIDTAVHYPVPCHRLAPYEADQPSLPVVERAAPTLLSLPMHPRLSRADVSRVCEVLGGALSDDREPSGRPSGPTRPRQSAPTKPTRQSRDPETLRRRWLGR